MCRYQAIQSNDKSKETIIKQALQKKKRSQSPIDSNAKKMKLIRSEKRGKSMKLRKPIKLNSHA